MLKTWKRYSNLGWAFTIFFYTDLLIAVTWMTGCSLKERYEIRQEASQILNFPNLNP